MRSDDINVRMAGLSFVDDSFKSIGDDLKTILPEIIPTLYELLEDPAESVQETTRELWDNLPDYIHEPNLDAYIR